MRITGKRIPLLALALLAACSTLPARGEEATAPSPTIEQAVIALRVEAREPVGEGTSFPADVGQLACYTKVTGAAEETFIHHVWYHGETERARVRLPVRGRAWRTWSTKRINPAWVGSWTVKIEDAAGTVLDSLTFNIEATVATEEGG